MAELLLLLETDSYRTASDLAMQLGVSEKTVRNTIRDFSDAMEGSGVEIVSKSRHGYCLIVTDQDAYQDLCRRAKELTSPAVSVKDLPTPDNTKDRMEYLMARLLYTREYVKLDDISEFLYVSRSTLSHSIGDVEAVFRQYGLSIDRRPNYGIRAVGREFDKRRLIADYFVKRPSSIKDEPEGELKHIASIAEDLLIKYDISLSETEFENFIDYTYVAVHRAGDGFGIEHFDGQVPEIGIKEQLFVKELLSEVEKEKGQPPDEDERRYLEIYLSGKRMIGNALADDRNFVIHEQTDRLALEILSVLSSDYHMNLLDNFDLRMTLNQHLAPFDIRMRFNIPLKNPLLPDIRRDYPLAYQMGQVAASVLSDHYGKPVSEDEIGYLAVILQLVLEKESDKKKYNILIVCSTGKSTSRLLKYRFEQQFSNYLDKLYICDLLGLGRFDFSQVDYVFTTVPITVAVSVPIIEVGSFLVDADIKKISETLRDGDRSRAIMSYFG
ncbi:MAG: BglG family transcription antiterminator, partial [Candidatus Weimeria sp.]